MEGKNIGRKKKKSLNVDSGLKDYEQLRGVDSEKKISFGRFWPTKRIIIVISRPIERRNDQNVSFLFLKRFISPLLCYVTEVVACVVTGHVRGQLFCHVCGHRSRAGSTVLSRVSDRVGTRR